MVAPIFITLLGATIIGVLADSYLGTGVTSEVVDLIGETFASFFKFILGFVIEATKTFYSMVIDPILESFGIGYVGDAIIYLLSSLFDLLNFAFQNIGFLFVMSQLIIVLITLRENDLSDYISTFINLEVYLLTSVFMFVFYAIEIGNRLIIGVIKTLTSMIQNVRG